MSVNLHHLRESEDRIKASLVSALNSALILVLMLLVILAVGFVLARR